jgi:single-strand DNA-binding protein
MEERNMNMAPVTIVGNLTDEPQLTFTTNGQARLSFSVATNHVWYDQSNEKQEKASYINVTAWRYLAENSARTLEKGIGVVIYGRLEQRSYDDKDGNKRSIVEIVADEIAIATKSLETIERRRGNGGEGSAAGAPAQRSNQQGGAPRRSRPVTAKAGVSGSSDDGMDEPF